MSNQKKPDDLKPDTKLSHLGREPKGSGFGTVNVPVHHASTILFDDANQMATAKNAPYGSPYYGRRGTPTQFHFQEMLAELEGGFRTLLTPSGLSAISTALCALTEAGDHILVTDSAYDPTRSFCEGFLKKYGVETTYYDPTLSEDIAALIQSNTKLVFVESPGSLTFEVQDIPAIAKAAHEKGALVVADNTWATPLFCNVLALGADISVVAATKYIGGHSDVMMGTITVRDEKHWPALFRCWSQLGMATGPDDAYLAQRGLRTMNLRLAKHHENGIALANWFEMRPEVQTVFHPALPSHAGHSLWQRDFSGASGLFGVQLKAGFKLSAVQAMLDSTNLFGQGFSWGGYESLFTHSHPDSARTATTLPEGGQWLRVHAGLEDAEDLINDLEQAITHLN